MVGWEWGEGKSLGKRQWQHSQHVGLDVPSAQAARGQAGAFLPSPCSAGTRALPLASASGARQSTRAKHSEGLCCPGPAGTTGPLLSKPCTVRVTPLRPGSHTARAGQLQHCSCRWFETARCGDGPPEPPPRKAHQQDSRRQQGSCRHAVCPGGSTLEE